MIVVKIELWPKGDERRKRLLHLITITNTGGTRTKGIYRAALTAKYPLSGRPPTAWKTTRITAFPRQRLGAYDLLYRVLANIVGPRNT